MGLGVGLGAGTPDARLALTTGVSRSGVPVAMAQRHAALWGDSDAGATERAEDGAWAFLAHPVVGPEPLRVDFERSTSLVDGGFGHAPEIDETAVSEFESPGERFDRYRLDLEWSPVGGDAQVQWLVLGGIRAVHADIARSDSESLSLTEARGTVAIPTIGTGVRWKPSESLVFSTTASTQTVETNGGVLDVSLNAEFRFSPTVGLRAGYEFYQSDMVVEDLRTSLDREGVFAKLTIRF